MKIAELLFESKIQLSGGTLNYNWKSDLEDEEHEDYLPKGYSKKVLELVDIAVKEPGKGVGSQLMKKFLDTPAAKSAELIFLDPVPWYGENENSELSEDEQIEKLKRFYSRFGFRSNKSANRMWRVQKGDIPSNKLPT